MKINLPVTDREVLLQEEDNLLTTTDLKGAITYANPTFVHISGYAAEELIGKNHNIIRHPHMPPEAFRQMWESLRRGRNWMGLVKNRSKSGDCYWVSAYVTPIHENGQVVEYQSVRTRPSRQQVAAAEAYYAALQAGKSPWAIRLPVLGLFGRLALGCVVLQGGIGLLAVLLGLASTGLLVMLTVACLLLLVGLWQQLGPLRALVQRARQVGDNPLSQWLYSGRRDEFGQLAFAFTMQEAEAAALVGRISDAARRLAEQSGEMVEAVRQCNQVNRCQQDETDQVAAAVEQMATSVQEVAHSAQQAANDAEGVERATSDGHRVVEQTGQQMQQLTAAIGEASERLQRLAAQSERISEVVGVINAIAEQTNLLALNAAIEAARAGELGRGFAVVADEVRALAGRTQQSTASIRESVETLQQGSREAVSAMQASLVRVDQCVEGVTEATRALDGIERRIAGISQASVQIAAAVEQQSQVSEQISCSLQRIRQSSEQNAEAMQRNDAHAGQLAELVLRLELLASEFWLAHRGSSEVAPQMLTNAQGNHRRGLCAQNPWTKAGRNEATGFGLGNFAATEPAFRADQ